MNNLSIIMTSVALAMDAFAASLCIGLEQNKVNFISSIKVGIWFGIFQGIMPLIGYLLSYRVNNLIILVDHLVAFLILIIIGINMIIDSFKEDDKNYSNLDFKTMFFLSLATSIDALAVGISFAFLNVNIVYSIIIISSITFILTFIGVFIGKVLGEKYKQKMTFIGGVILVIIAIKTLVF